MKYLGSLLAESKNFILLAALILLLGALLGYVYHDLFMQVIQQALEQLEEISKQLEEDPSPKNVSMLIFQNNVKAALLMIGLGTILFFAPAISLFVNGLAVGFILKVSAVGGMSAGGILLYGIMPHGILELPAIIVAGGIGIFLGWRVLRWVVRKISMAIRPKESVSEARDVGQPVLMNRLKGLALLVVMLVVVLFAAAYIEGYITPSLLEKYMGL